MSSTDSHMKHHDHGSEECKKICGDSAEKCHKSGAECQHEKHAGCTPACHPGDHKDCSDKSCCKLTCNMPETHPHHEGCSEECKKKCGTECKSAGHHKPCCHEGDKSGHAECPETCQKGKCEGSKCCKDGGK
nr:expressed protein [Hymenolepis microstoma]